MSTATKSIEEMTSEEIEQMLAKRKEKERRIKEKTKAAYESERDDLVTDLVLKAKSVNELLSKFKEELHVYFEEHKEKLNDYGGVRSNSKGGFSLVHSSGEIKATRLRSTQPVWDERAEKSLELINDFLHTTVKKSHRKLFEVLLSYIQKNKSGDLEYAKVMDLISHRDKWKDERWLKGLDLLEESFSIAFRSFSYAFYVKDKDGKWEPININFSSL